MFNLTLLRYIFLSILLFFSSCSKEEIDTTNNTQIGRFLDDWTFDVFTSSESYKNTFKLWIPDEITPRAILAITTGGYGNGINMVSAAEWQEYAKKEKIALLGCYISPSSEESANNLNIAIKNIAEKQGLDYLSNLPILLRGFSSGGRFSYDFSNLYSNKVVAFANIKGRINEYDSKLPAGLFIIGEKDLLERNENIEKAFNRQRALGAISTLAVEPNGYHSDVGVDNLVRDFFSSILKKRLGENNELLEIDTKDIYLANNKTTEVLPFSEYIEDKEKASCLVDERFKNKWLDFVN